MSDLVLYNYFRSSTSYRARIALHHKQLSFDYRSVHLVKNGGEQHSADYRQLNAMGEVPTLVHKGKVIAQSLAIIQYLEDVFPDHPLFPKEPVLKAQILQFCENVNAGMHPLQNFKVMKYLSTHFSATEEQRQAWLNEWMGRGLKSLESLVNNHGGDFCFGNHLTAADCVLVPQLFSARRFKVPIEQYKSLLRIEERCLRLDAFEKAHPANQIDSEN